MWSPLFPKIDMAQRRDLEANKFDDSLDCDFRPKSILFIYCLDWFATIHLQTESIGRKRPLAQELRRQLQKKSHSICWSSPRCWCGITCHDKKQIGFFKEGFMSWHPVSKILQLPSLHTKESLFCLATSPLVGLSDWNDSFWLFDKHVKVRPCCLVHRDNQPR